MKNWLRQLIALLKKEGKQIVRDPSSYLVALILPIIFLLFFGYAITLDVGTMKLAILLEGNGAYTNNLCSTFQNSETFDTIQVYSRAEANRLMTESKVNGVLVIPHNFDKNFFQGNKADVQLMIDATEPNNARFLESYANGIITTWLLSQMEERGVKIEMPIVVEARYWYNNSAKSRWALVPGSITIVMTLIGTLLTSLVITREWERGTMEVLFSTPVSRMQIFLSKLLPYYLLAIFSMSLCTAAAVFIFDIPFRGSVWALFLITSAFLLPALGQGLLISSFFRSQLLSAIVGFLSGLLPAFILSGQLYDIQSMPRAIQLITYLIPARYFTVALQTAFLAGDIWDIYLPAMLYMVILGGIFLLISYHNIQKRLD